ncbi:hypothetical protein [Streptomyces sp. BA2]|nr:hypothetical protein [Streptomyces sp. BA2]
MAQDGDEQGAEPEDDDGEDASARLYGGDGGRREGPGKGAGGRAEV